MKNILFVCTGNSCRSVMAEGLFKKIAADSGAAFSVSSAGISALDGFPATDETVRVMKQYGVDVSDHRSRRLTYPMIDDADKIFVMEEVHRNIILKQVPDAEPKVALLTEFLPEHRENTGHRDIPDPIRMSDNFYKNVSAVIASCVEGAMKSLREEII